VLLPVAIVLVWVLSKVKASEEIGFHVTGNGPTRGWRNKNLLNIRYSPANDWQGQTGDDGAFSVFDTFGNGFRAAVRIIARYRTVYGENTVDDIIQRFAPLGDGYNNPAAYVASVETLSGLTAETEVNTVDKAAKLLKAMAYVESRADVSLDSARNSVARWGQDAFL